VLSKLSGLQTMTPNNRKIISTKKKFDFGNTLIKRSWIVWWWGGEKCRNLPDRFLAYVNLSKNLAKICNNPEY